MAEQWIVLKKYEDWDTDVWFIDDKIVGPNGEVLYTNSSTDAVEIAAALNRDRAANPPVQHSEGPTRT